MQIHSLYLQNFKQYRETTLNFSEGLTGFVGKNGAGKSTIFESVSLAFYGRSDAVKEKIRNDKAKDSAPVVIEMCFEDLGVKYTVKREFRGKALKHQAKLKKENDEVASTPESVNREIARIIKIDYKNFRNSFFAHQKDVASLLDTGVNERKASFRKMLGLERLDKIQDKVTCKIKEISSEVKGMEKGLLAQDELDRLNKESEEKKNELALLEEKLEVENKNLAIVKKAYESLKKSLEETEKIKNEHDKCTKATDLKKQNIAFTNKSLKSSLVQLEELNREKLEYENLLPVKNKYSLLELELKSLRSEKEKLIERNNMQKNLSVREKSLQEEGEELEILKSSLAGYQGLDDKINSLESLKKSLRENLETYRKLVSEVNAETGNLKGEKDTKTKRLNRITERGADAPCPECEQPLGSHFSELVESYKNSLEEITKRLQNCFQNLAELEDKIKTKDSEITAVEEEIKGFRIKQSELMSLQKNIESAERHLAVDKRKYEEEKETLANLGNVLYDENEHKQKEEEERSLKLGYEKCLSLEGSLHALPQTEARIAEYRSTLNTMNEELVLLGKQFKSIAYDESLYEELKKEREAKEEIYNEAKDSLHLVKTLVSEVRAGLKNIADRLSNDEGQKENIAEILKKQSGLVRLKDVINSFKETVTSRELPEISRLASNLFTKVTRGSYVNLRIKDDFEFVVTRDGLETGLVTLSGGEKDLAGLCLRIALSKRISTLAGRSNMGFLALDEVFGSQDLERREDLLNALGVITKDFRQIFVVSHNEDVQDGFPNRIMISKRNGSSVAVMQ